MLITFGCSLTLDNYKKTWANILAEKLHCKLLNLAQRGSGIDFITKRLLLYPFKKKDKVGIMLPSADRFDWYVDKNSHVQNEAVSIAAWQNGKSRSLINLNGEMSNSYGFCLSGGWHRGIKKYYYKYYYSELKSRLDFWQNVYTIQLHLKKIKVPYFFTSAYRIDNNIEQELNRSFTKDKTVEKIIKCIDMKNFIWYKDKKGFLDFCHDKNYKFEGHYPVEEAHNTFVNEILLKSAKKILF